MLLGKPDTQLTVGESILGAKGGELRAGPGLDVLHESAQSHPAVPVSGEVADIILGDLRVGPSQQCCFGGDIFSTASYLVRSDEGPY